MRMMSIYRQGATCDDRRMACYLGEALGYDLAATFPLAPPIKCPILRPLIRARDLPDSEREPYITEHDASALCSCRRSPQRLAMIHSTTRRYASTYRAVIAVAILLAVVGNSSPARAEEKTEAQKITAGWNILGVAN